MATGQQVKDNGWRQGSFLPSTLALSLSVAHDCEDVTHAVVISQDCDVTHPELEVERYVEILFVQAIDVTNPGLTDGKSSRFLHLEAVRDSAVQGFAALAWNKARIDRASLAVESPDTTISIPSGTLRGMVRWIGDRYTRTGFPDEFVKRTEHIEKPLIKLMKKEGSAFWRILVSLDSFDELPTDAEYAMDCACVVHPEFWENPVTQEQALAAGDALKALIQKCDGIQLGEFEVNTSDELPLSYLHHYRPWDVFNYLTHRDLLKDDHV
jgi:hypothetical protein